MKSKEQTYSVATEERTYNTILSREHLETVLENWGDESSILVVDRWNQEAQIWERITLDEIQETDEGDLMRYTALNGEMSIISIGATNRKDAKSRIEDQLRRPGRRGYLDVWKSKGSSLRVERY